MGKTKSTCKKGCPCKSKKNIKKSSCLSCNGAKKIIGKNSNKLHTTVGLVACPANWSPCVLPSSARCKPRKAPSKKSGPLIAHDCAPIVHIQDNGIIFGGVDGESTGNFTLGSKYKFKKLKIKGTAMVDTSTGTGGNILIESSFKEQAKTDNNGNFTFPLPDGTASFFIIVTMNIKNGCGCGKKKCCVRIRSQEFSQYVDDLYWMSYDGSANNLADPRIGMVGTALLQATDVTYEDGVSTLAVRGPNNPNPRVISNSICKDVPGGIPSTLNMTDLVWGFGQFLDHEISLTPNDEDVFANFSSLPSDPNEDFPGRTIIFHRSEFIAGSSPRLHPNHISSYIDGTNVYGYSRERAYALREFDGNGTMILDNSGLLPVNNLGLPNENGGSLPDDELFLAGDLRSNENVLLIANHTLFVREHNRLCTDVIPNRYPQFVGQDELMYQHARRINTGIMQAITFNEFLPALLGPHGLEPYTGYDSSIDSGIRKEFATVGYRLGHTMLSDVLKIGSSGDTLALMDAFFSPDWIKTNGIDGVLLGAGLQLQQEIDGKIVDAVRNNLFGPPTAGNLLDLAAINIQRGRDHGIGSFNDVRVAYGLPPRTNFAQFSSETGVATKLETLYGVGQVDAVDPWIGCIIEDHLPGAAVGETLVAILKEQFTRLRDGDRFFYLNDAGLSQEEKDEISSTTFADVIIRNTNITSASFGGRTDVFHL